MTNLPSLKKHETTLRRSLLLSALYLITVLTLNSTVVTDPDIWWHLRTGQWIVEHGTVPTTDPFSMYGMGKVWVAYSWLFELLIYSLYKLFGLAGIVVYVVALSLAINVALHNLVRKLEPRVAIAVVITALSMIAIHSLFTPRPWLFTILFFIIEFDVLWTARRTGNRRLLLLLPPLFALWANIHIQFIYGLFVLGLATAEPLLHRFLRRSIYVDEKQLISTSQMLFISAACVVATFINPYHLLIYKVVYEYMSQPGPFQYVSELQAPSFRGAENWCGLIMTLGAVFALGWRREVKPFPVLLLSTGAFLFFRAERDVWFVVTVAATIIAASRPIIIYKDSEPLTKLQVYIAVAITGLLIVLTARIRHVSESEMQQQAAKIYPVAAANVVEARGYPGPLYNNFDWGGYLIWRLPQLPVSLDGRTNLHGDKRINRSIATWSGKHDWKADSELSTARLVIAAVDQPLASLLRSDSRFELVYEDSVAAVFVARRGP